MCFGFVAHEVKELKLALVVGLELDKPLFCVLVNRHF